MRIFELAKKLNVSSSEIMELLEMRGIEAGNHFCALTPDQVGLITEDITGDPSGVESAADPDPSSPTRDGEETAEAAPAADVPAASEPEVSADAPADVPADVPSETSPEASAEAPAEPEAEEEKGPPVLELFEDVTVKELAGKIDVKANVLIASLMKMGVFASINQKITRAQSKILAEANGFKVLTEPPKPKPAAPQPSTDAKADSVQKSVSSSTGGEPPAGPPKPVKEKKKKIRNTKSADSDGKTRDPSQVTRPPVITFLGHVDHGKTSLIDRIRKANVVKGEAGGITQHIGAYTIEIKGKEITILDTPGHAAFSAMRARGADLTDIAIIVISADEGMKPQTREAIKHAQEAGVTLMVAANKIDLPNANVDRLKQELQKEGLAPEDWGGDTMVVPVSAMTGEGIDDLLDMVNLQAEVLELTSTLGVPARGYVIEAELETGMGATASVLVTEGVLNVGDAMLCGESAGRIKALIDHNGKRVKSAGPSHAVKVMGLSEVPSPGDEFEIVKNDKIARQLAAERQEANRKSALQGPERGLSLDDLFAQAGLDDIEELQILLKCDVKGSLEAITASLKEIKSDKVRLKFISSGIGPINENDVLLASSSGSLIIGFNVGKDNAAVRAAKHKGVEIRLYDIIYQLIDDITAAMTGLLKPVQQEKVIGHAEIRQIFKLRKARSVAGCIVIDGRIRAKARARVLRGKAKDIIYQGGVHTLKRFQDDVNEVGNGQECGIGLENYDDFETGDIIEVYLTEDVKQAL